MLAWVMMISHYGFVVFGSGKSLESVLARLNRLRSTKLDAAEIAELTRLPALFFHVLSVNASQFCYKCGLL